MRLLALLMIVMLATYFAPAIAQPATQPTAPSIAQPSIQPNAQPSACFHASTAQWGDKIIALTRAQARVVYGESGDTDALLRSARAALNSSTCASIIVKLQNG